MRRKIPSTAALVSFESAARHESFTKAAEELSLTQSALCRPLAPRAEVRGVGRVRSAR
ncbi:LysR family transcriptional regulator, partial [Pseudomonas aeruginosa]|nr:LysR family transcriptional regulator [Pseudomonas aeruginosa]